MADEQQRRHTQETVDAQFNDNRGQHCADGCRCCRMKVGLPEMEWKYGAFDHKSGHQKGYARQQQRSIILYCNLLGELRYIQTAVRGIQTTDTNQHEKRGE